MDGDGIAVVSGGLDSVTMLHHLLDAGRRPDVVTFDYGQRHAAREIFCARQTAAALDVRWDLVPLHMLGALLAPSGSALVSDTDVPDGHYAQDSMRATVVPNRNMIMLSIAAGMAIARHGTYVATATHSGDHFIYPDCRPEFMAYLGQAITAGNEGFTTPRFSLLTPFLHMSKADIAQRAGQLDVPVHQTWSCYRGGQVHCGRCGTCVERLEAIHLAGIPDATIYADPDYWTTQVRA